MIYQEDIKVININLEIISDSAYVVNAFVQGWIYNWLKKGWAFLMAKFIGKKYRKSF